MVGVAIGGAALVGAAGSAISSSNNKKAIDKSTDATLQANRETLAAQQAAFDKSLNYQQQAFNSTQNLNADTYNSSGQLQTDIYNQNIGILQPWATRGNQAGNQINALLGLGTAAAYNPKTLTFDPVTTTPITVATPTPATGTVGATPQPNTALSGTPNNSALIAALQAQGRTY